MTLGERLRELRIAEPYLTIREAAKLLRSHPRWLSDVECNRTKPSADALNDFATVYGGDARELAGLWLEWRPASPTGMSKVICTGRPRRAEF
jgi:transcriptional regulator with XRE-family HTH domain